MTDKTDSQAKLASAEITLDFKQAAALLEMFGGEPAEITLVRCDGHSGPGLYAYYADYPDEGTIFLGEIESEAVPATPAAPGAAPVPSSRHKPGDWVWLKPGAGMCVEADRLPAQIQADAEPRPCCSCGEAECVEWATLLTAPDPQDGGKRRALYHVGECQMLDRPNSDGVPAASAPAQARDRPLATASPHVATDAAIFEAGRRVGIDAERKRCAAIALALGDSLTPQGRAGFAISGKIIAASEDDTSPALPSNAAELRKFIGTDFESLEGGRADGVPSDDDRYRLTAHHLLSAIERWVSFAV